MEDKLEATKNTLAPVGMYPNANIGTENISSEDLNTPVLKIIQKTTEGAEDMQIGSYLLPDGKQEKSVTASLVYVSTLVQENYQKTKEERIKVYYGFLSGTVEPFKMYIRGWGLASHRDFQTEVMRIKNEYGLPMLALEVTLTTEKIEGNISDSGKPYTTFKPVFTITKDAKGVPFVETDPERGRFLIEASKRFSELSETSKNDEKMNEVNPEDIPF